jgi:regulator of RNase E activity RraA
VHTADILMVGKAVSDCPPDHVIVIDGHGEPNTALWGGIITIAARLKGLAGAVIDGAIRDSAEIAVDSFPLFARAVVPNAGGAQYLGEMNIPIQCGGLVVNPGDWVVGDDDGVAVVPAGQLQDTLSAAEQLREVEKQITAAVMQGKDLGALLHYDDILERKRQEGLLPQLRFTKDD